MRYLCSACVFIACWKSITHYTMSKANFIKVFFVYFWYTFSKKICFQNNDHLGTIRFLRDLELMKVIEEA